MSDPGMKTISTVEPHHMIALSSLGPTDTSASVEEQTKQALAAIDKYLAQAGANTSNVLSVTIYLSDVSLRPEMDKAWYAWIDPENPPVRCVVGAQLEDNAKVRMVATAACPGSSLQGFAHSHAQGDAHTHVRLSSEAALAGDSHAGHDHGDDHGHSHGGHSHSH